MIISVTGVLRRTVVGDCRFNNLSLFLVSKPGFECNSLIVVDVVGNARNRVPIDSVACLYAVFGDIVEVNIQ